MENANRLLTRIEQTRLWAYFHKDWLLQIRALLRPQLPPEYYVFVESETILISPDDSHAPAVLPDVSIGRPVPQLTEPRAAESRGTPAVVEAEEPCEVFSKYSLLIRRAPENRVVAVLEVLSPSNKGVGNRFDREKHLRKRDSLLEAGVNLLEVDALLYGDRDLPDPLGELGGYDRVAWAAQHDDSRRRFRGWGWNEADPLPEISWAIEDRLTVIVDLAGALAEAAEFNRWEDLVTSAEGQRD